MRIKDIADLKGVRENQLVGYGLVIGLKGTGDTLRNAPFTEQSLQSMLDNMGINVRRTTTLRTRNVAAVIVTADLPPFVGRRFAHRRHRLLARRRHLAARAARWS